MKGSLNTKLDKVQKKNLIQSKFGTIRHFSYQADIPYNKVSSYIHDRLRDDITIKEIERKFNKLSKSSIIDGNKILSDICRQYGNTNDFIFLYHEEFYKAFKEMNPSKEESTSYLKRMLYSIKNKTYNKSNKRLDFIISKLNYAI